MSIFITVVSTRIRTPLPARFKKTRFMLDLRNQLTDISNLHGISAISIDAAAPELEFTISGGCSAVAAARLRHALQGIIDTIPESP